MNRQAILFSAISFFIGMSVMSIIKNSQHSKEIKLYLDTANVTADITKQYINANEKLQQHNAKLVELAMSYENATSALQKKESCDNLVAEVKNF